MSDQISNIVGEKSCF